MKRTHRKSWDSRLCRNGNIFRALSKWKEAKNRERENEGKKNKDDVKEGEKQQHQQQPSAPFLPQVEELLGAGGAVGLGTCTESRHHYGKRRWNHFSPISSHTEGRTTSDSRVVQMPMVPVGNIQAQLVFRPWTTAEVREAISHLPDLNDNSEKFARVFVGFCQEFCP